MDSPFRSPFENTGPCQMPDTGTGALTRIVGFEEDRHPDLVKHPNLELCQLVQKPERQGSLGQQLLHHNQLHLETNRPKKLSLTTKSSRRLKPVATTTGNSASSTGSGAPKTPQHQQQADRASSITPIGTLPSGGAHTTMWLARANTEPLPIPDISPSRLLRSSHSRPPSNQPSPRINVAANQMARTSSTRLNGSTQYTNNQGNSSSGSATPQFNEELRQAHLQAEVLKQALLKERQEVVRLRQELRRLALTGGSSQQYLQSNSTEEEEEELDEDEYAASQQHPPMMIDTEHHQGDVVMGPVTPAPINKEENGDAMASEEEADQVPGLMYSPFGLTAADWL